MDLLRPYSRANFVVGQWRFLLALRTASDAASGPSDIVELESPYKSQDVWFDVGGFTGSSSYSSGHEAEGIDIEQESGTIFDEITDTNRTFTIPIAELTPQMISIIEAAPDPIDEGGFKRVPLTSITDLPEYRLAAIGVRKKSDSLVDEGSIERGSFVVITLNSVTLAADDREGTFEKGALSQIPVTFQANPDPDVADPDGDGDWGNWFFEEPGPVGVGSA